MCVAPARVAGKLLGCRCSALGDGPVAGVAGGWAPGSAAARTGTDASDSVRATSVAAEGGLIMSASLPAQSACVVGRGDDPGPPRG